ncbi:MAG: hypothetical protein R3Y28_08720 [Candidatus Gastranaerophilales bacterium]
MKSLLKKILIFLLIDLVLFIGILLFPIASKIDFMLGAMPSFKGTQEIHLVNASTKAIDILISYSEKLEEEKVLGAKSVSRLKINSAESEYCEIEYKIDGIVKSYKFNTSLKKDSYYIFFKESNDLVFESMGR